jgi:hypothetical protein
MHRNARSFSVAALLTAGLLCATPTIAAEATADGIASKMGGVVDSLGHKETGKPVQTEQKTIVQDLDALIASLEKQCQECKNGIKRNNPREGMKDSMIRSGTGGIGTLTGADDNGKDWGKLSAGERDRILQSMSEGFPPEYRTVLERYYRRLAEEKTAKSSTAKVKEEPAKP